MEISQGPGSVQNMCPECMQSHHRISIMSFNNLVQSVRHPSKSTSMSHNSKLSSSTIDITCHAEFGLPIPSSLFLVIIISIVVLQSAVIILSQSLAASL